MLRNLGRLGFGPWHKALASTLVVLWLGLFGLSSGLFSSLVEAKNPVVANRMDTLLASQLPAQGRDMMTLIYQGGPFRYDKDGSVFGNREKILPAQNRGYYREYTVRTLGERSRGARRIVCGGVKPTVPDACYYTDDHYASFRRIVQ